MGDNTCLQEWHSKKRKNGNKKKKNNKNTRIFPQNVTNTNRAGGWLKEQFGSKPRKSCYRENIG